VQAGGPEELVLWDLREGNLSGIPREEVHWMVRELTRFSDAKRVAGRSAFVVASDMDYDVIRMLVTHTEPGGVPPQVFRDVATARAWLRGPGPSL
jgi:hypothetical protein